jgi:hypothetical protein
VLFDDNTVGMTTIDHASKVHVWRVVGESCGQNCSRPARQSGQLPSESTRQSTAARSPGLSSINQIIKDHLDSHTYAAQARMFHVSRSIFSRLVDTLTEEELSKHAVTIAKKDFVDIGLLLRGEFTHIILKHLGKLVTNIFLLDYLFIFE